MKWATNCDKAEKARDLNIIMEYLETFLLLLLLKALRIIVHSLSPQYTFYNWQTVHLICKLW